MPREALRLSDILPTDPEGAQTAPSRNPQARSPYDFGSPSGISPYGRMDSWNIEGRQLPSTVEPLPHLKNPGRYWIQNEQNEWSVVDPRDYPESGPSASGRELSQQEIDRIRELVRSQMSPELLADLTSRRIAPPPQ